MPEQEQHADTATDTETTTIDTGTEATTETTDTGTMSTDTDTTTMVQLTEQQYLQTTEEEAEEKGFDWYRSIEE